MSVETQTETVRKSYATLPFHNLPWKWTPKRIQAAAMLCSAKTESEVCETLGISSMSLLRWKQREEFQDRCAELLAELDRAMRASCIASRSGQIKILAQDFNATSQILKERGVDCAWMDEQGNLLPFGGPGGATGFIAREYQGAGKQQQAVFKVDAALFKVRQDILKQIAILRGFWTEKAAVEHSGEVKIAEKLSDAELERELRATAEVLGFVAPAATLVKAADGVYQKAAEEVEAASVQAEAEEA
jgi:hypothetical protein